VSIASFRRRTAGVSLVELMVAMTLGLIVAGGFVAVFLAVSASQRTLTQFARLQESGRFAIARVTRDLRMANAFHCPHEGGVPVVHAIGLSSALHDVTTRWGPAPYPAAPSSPYRFPSFLWMRGYQCGKTSCLPEAPASLPSMGRAVGQRVVGADVLTLRYLDLSGGWSAGAGAVVDTADGTIHHVAIHAGAEEQAISDVFQPGDLLMLADCSSAQIFSASLQGGNTFYPDAVETGRNVAPPAMPRSFAALRLFDFNRDFRTVTYYLQVVDAGDGAATGALMRRENGVASEVVRGVERMDFRYGVEDTAGAVRHLTAARVDDRGGGSIACPADDDGYVCLWRVVRSIEVHVLMDGQQVHGALDAVAMRYAYSIDGDLKPAPPDAATRAVRPSEQGFDPRMLRREFSAFVAVRHDSR